MEENHKDRSQNDKDERPNQPKPEEQGLASEPDRDASHAPRHIVGIGASAGGLDALKQLFQSMPKDIGVGFVVISHMDPKHHSLMPEILQRHTEMEVVQAEDNCAIAANTVYIIPPGQDMSLKGGRLKLIKRNSPSSPIDYFLRSLAQDRKAHAIGVILTGTGSDGTLGIKAIKEHFGLAICQSRETAQYPGMPESAMRTGMVDYEAPINEIPGRILGYIQSRHQTVQQGYSLDEGQLTEGQLKALNKVFFYLRSKTGHDFSAYKKSTILRRIERRMHVHQLDTIEKYAKYLQENPEEARSLFKELLIGVTSFFRDPEAFEILRTTAFPKLLDKEKDGNTIRVWVPGTATGEEAYSVAIAIREYLEQRERGAKLQVFATDIDDEAIDVARRGQYPASIAEDVDQGLLERYFTRENEGYRIKREIRETVIFAVQDMVKDPPFTRLDMVCCRNLLIYLNADLQHKIIPTFHYSLREDGILFLGSSESVGEFTDLFATIDSRWKLFRRRPSSEARSAPLELNILEPLAAPAIHSKLPSDVKVTDSIGQLLLDEFAPPSAVIHRNGDIVYIHGRTGRYLEPASGRMNVRITDMAREGLAAQLSTMIRKAINTQSKVSQPGIQVKSNDSYSSVHVTVMPLPGRLQPQDLLLVTFEEGSEQEEKPAPAVSEHDRDKDAETLRQELKDTRYNLQSTVEELETSNEELRSMNEEYQSTNEELKSANEELETSREELQSLNEELSTVNRELEDKLQTLQGIQSELQSFLDSLDSPTVFVDNQLRIKRFTRQASRVVSVAQGDIGRPLTDLTTKLRDDDMAGDVRHVLETLRYREKEVQTDDGHWFLRRVVPYRRHDDTIQGVVINFIDIEELKERTAEARSAKDEAARAETFFRAVFETVHNPLMLLDADLKVHLANPAFYRMFRLSHETTEGRRLDEIGDGGFDVTDLHENLVDVLPRKHSFEEFTIERDFAGLGKRRMKVNARQIEGTKGREQMILLGIRDATDE